MNNIGWALAVGTLLAWALDARLAKRVIKAKSEALDKMTKLAREANDSWGQALGDVSRAHDLTARVLRALDLSRYAAEQMRNSHAPGVKFFWEMTDAEKTMDAEPYDHEEASDGAVAPS